MFSFFIFNLIYVKSLKVNDVRIFPGDGTHAWVKMSPPCFFSDEWTFIPNYFDKNGIIDLSRARADHYSVFIKNWQNILKILEIFHLLF